MSNYFGKARHPITGKMEEVAFLDGYFGGRRYGVRFDDGKVFTEEYIESETKTKKVSK